MKILKIVQNKKVICTTKLDNGVFIEIYGDYALGSDGKTYYHVGYEDEEGDLHTLGWSCDTDKSVIVEK